MASSPDSLRAFAQRAALVWGFALEEALLAAWIADCVTAPLERVDVGVVIACGVFHRNPAAIACFEQRVVPRVRASIRKLGVKATEAEEHLQTTRVRLFAEDQGARLKTYRGLGTFEAFVTTVAVRAWYSARSKGQTIVNDDAQLASLPAAVDLERALARCGQQQHFATAFRQALAGLPPRERALLRLNLVEGASIDELAPMYLVSRATVARWLSTAKQLVQVRTIGLLSQRTKLVGEELDGLMASLESGFDLSLRRLVVEAAEQGGRDEPPR